MRTFLLTIVLGACGFAASSTKETANRLEASAAVLQEIMGASDKGIPQDLLNKAECAVIVPGLKKGAFVFGAKYGRGFMSCRTGNAGWSAPAGVRIEGGSFGFQIGGSETDVIMLVLNRRGADKLMSSKFTLGGDASVAAGPVGRTSTAETDAFMNAEILSWSRSRGVFAGVSLKGSTLRPDDTANRDLYGSAKTTKEVVNSPDTPMPESGKQLIAELTRYSARK